MKVPGSPRPVPLSEYRGRREALRKNLGNAILLLEGNTESERGDTRNGFFQESSFLYLTGWQEPGALLLVAPGSAGSYKEILFLPDTDDARTLWTGSGLSAGTPGIARTAGFRRVERRSTLEATLQQLLARHEGLLTMPGTSTDQRLRQMFPFREPHSAQPLLASFRMVKSRAEIALLEEAVRITVEGQLRGWRSLQIASTEYEVAADVTHEFLRLGSERHAFAPIVASGPNACVLHYGKNRTPLRRGSLAILDIGAEVGGYTGDLTRTIPIGGRFSKRQRVLYEAVLAVQREVIRHLAPGTFLGRQVPGSLHHLAVELLRQMPLGPGGKPLSEYFPHGIGHHLGLDVHDLSDPMAPLQPGAVVTVEPGIYIPEEGIGIRIEDDVLVTDDGNRVLSAALPKEPGDVEALLSA